MAAGGSQKSGRCIAKHRLIHPKITRREATELDLLDRRALAERLAHSGNGHRNRKLDGIAIDTGADGRKCNGPQPELAGKLDGIPIAGRQQFRLAVGSAAPDGPHRVNDVLCREAIALGALGLAGLAAAQESAFMEQLRPCSAVDGAIDTAAAQKRGIGGIDDGVHLQQGDIGLKASELCGHGGAVAV